MKKSITLLLGLLLPLIGSAADFPERDITYQITFSPGGGSDIRARAQQPMLEEKLGVKMQIQYKPGGGGSLGWANMVKQKPDGYFMSGINIPHIILQPLARDNAGYETAQIEPVVLFQQIPFGLTVMADSPFQTLEDLVAYAKENPGAITVGGSGSWDATHIAHLQFEKLAGIKMTYIPHKGGKPKQTALLGGHTMASWFGTSEWLPHGDKVRNLAVATQEPVETNPDLPTFKSKGYELYSSVYHGVGVPQGTPADVIGKLQDTFVEIASSEDVRAQKLKSGIIPIAMPAAEAKALINDRIDAWAPIVKEFAK
jgi:tripartite-type tricarboxylate transporter receptor subunit TctC